MQLGSEPWIPDKQILEICHCRSETILLTPNSSCEDWSLTTLKEKLIKIGAKVVSHGRYVAFQMAEVSSPTSCD
jgi:hypothetical protein